MMKWKVMKNIKSNSLDHEDVRKSLEILDSVLAAYDDGTGDVPPSSQSCNDHKKDTEELIVNGGINTDTNTYNVDYIYQDGPLQFRNSFQYCSKDGATSHNEALLIDDEAKFSPPPVPKRNPTTRLSSRESLNLSDSTENIYSNSFEIRRHIFDNQANSSNNQSSKAQLKIKNHSDGTEPSYQLATKKNTIDKTDLDSNDDVFITKGKFPLSRSVSASMMTADTLQKSPSVSSRRALYENGNVQSENVKRPIVYSDSSENAYPVTNSPFLRRKLVAVQSPKIHRRNFSDSGNCNSPVYKISSQDEKLVVSHSKPSKGLCLFEDSNEERIARLNKKFAEVRYLLKTKQIKPLDCGPPQFVPIPPPKKIARKQNELDTHGVSSKQTSLDADTASKSEVKLTEKKDIILIPPVTLVDTISDISCILPSDVLNKPQLGLSYSMEDDLSPGVKELITSTPDKSQKSILGLSTFSQSQSISSIGSRSGQSDLDLNFSSLKEERLQIPEETWKSKTLPIGMKLGPPFPYITNIDYDCDMDNQKLSVGENRVKHTDNSDSFRSSSAPPYKHLLSRTNQFGKSKKAQKEKKGKNKDDSVSLKSDLSVEDGIILRKITALDGSTETNDLSGRKQVNSEDKKRRSVWKSILRRK